MSNSKFSIVIPTMWKYKPFTNFLKNLVQFPLVDEIIIINNDDSSTPSDPVLTHEKIKMVSFGKNIYVNPAWNYGVDRSKNNNICILNDDVIFDLKLFYHVEPILSTDVGVIGLCPGHAEHNQPPFVNGSINIQPWAGEHTMGFGCLMFVHKESWVDIPDALKVYYGDNWIFDTSLWRRKTNYIITDLLHFTPYAQTTGGMINDFMNKETTMYNPLLNDFKTGNTGMDKLKAEYEFACKLESDIFMHLPVLNQYAQKCKHVTEMGVRTGWSTRALLIEDIVLRSYDLELDPLVQTLFDTAKSINKDVEYIAADVLKIELDETDMLFIDTLHSHNQLKAELKLHAGKVRKYLAFHDTHTFGTKGQNELDGREDPYGLLTAILDFLINHPEWRIVHHSPFNNGFTVLERTGPTV